MKTHSMKASNLIWMIFIAILPLLAACQKENETDKQFKCPILPKEGSNNDIIGKWKLVKAQQAFAPSAQKPQDYSCDNIIYHYKENGILTISGVQKGMISDENGDYSFEFKNDRDSDGYLTLQIDKNSYSFDIKNNEMTLDDSPLDGPIRYFIRVE